MRKYCGIPELDLSAQHVLDVYVFISKGYHQYGIEWNGRPVNLEPIRAETARIVAEERIKRASLEATGSNLVATTPPPSLSANPNTEAEARVRKLSAPLPEPPPPRKPEAPTVRTTWWFIAGALGALVGILLLSRKQYGPPHS